MDEDPPPVLRTRRWPARFKSRAQLTSAAADLRRPAASPPRPARCGGTRRSAGSRFIPSSDL
ncbi:hypothetical protein STTU_3322 [Streptomyces sp. Tu6071]|nr:hypothetical protein STTU_3322 [Streptomyces sp. Tu6071]